MIQAGVVNGTVERSSASIPTPTPDQNPLPGSAESGLDIDAQFPRSDPSTDLVMSIKNYIPQQDGANDGDIVAEPNTDAPPNDEDEFGRPLLNLVVILEEIFSRIPLEALLRFRETCRSFYNRTFDLDYIYRHLDFSHERFLRLHQRVQVIDPVDNSQKSSPIPDRVGEGSYICSVVHCDGLLLSRNQRSPILILWNPHRNQLRHIEPMVSLSAFDIYGIGYSHDARKEYKLLRIYDAEKFKEDANDIDQLEIYETKACLWRRLDATPLDWRVEGSRPGLSVKGNMYWIASPKSELRSGIVGFVQCFDFSKEKFSQICELPVLLDYDHLHTNALSGYKGNRLSLMHQGPTTDIKVWVTNSLTNDTVAWSHLFTVAGPDLPQLRVVYDTSYPVHFLDRNGMLVLLCSEDVGDNTNEDSDGEEEDAHIRMYKIGELGIQDRVHMGEATFFEHVMCGYIYTPSQVSAYN